MVEEKFCDVKYELGKHAKERESKKADLKLDFHFLALPVCEFTRRMFFFADFEFSVPLLYFIIVLLTHACTAKRADVSSLHASGL